jgi:alpha-tubulin suppressor-like RCC1 family protein
LALVSGGAVWAWGGNAAGELGDGSKVSSDIPVAVRGLDSETIAISGGHEYGLALRVNGTMMSGGRSG